MAWVRSVAPRENAPVAVFTEPFRTVWGCAKPVREQSVRQPSVSASGIEAANLWEVPSDPVRSPAAGLESSRTSPTAVALKTPS
ncbi:hypothetical protein CF54_14845 [Streptomyces sp. Tu 6176]|nr:hypothetical protein CF54_14845 [Streptomyces sp. Tu 6176]